MLGIIKRVCSRLRRSGLGATLVVGRGQSASDVFRGIYRSNYWGSTDSRSGTGSDLTQTAEIRRQLPELLRAYDMRTMLDIPCGDWNWMKELALDVDYIGADIVPEVVQRNQELYGSDRRRFMVLDMTQDTLPKADLVFSRDVLVHFSFEDVFLALRNFKRSGSTYLLTTTFTAREANIPIPTGHWRPLNLQKPPFGFPNPIALINEKCTEGDGSWRDKSLGLWKLCDLPEVAT